MVKYNGNAPAHCPEPIRPCLTRSPLMPTIRRRALLSHLALSAFLLTGCGGGADAEATPPAQVVLAGSLDRPGAVTLPQLQALPATTQTVSFASGNGNQTRTYTGASAWAVLSQAGIQVD